MNIIVDDLSNGAVIELLQEHLADMYATSPPESVHALDAEALKSPEITFFSAWDEQVLAGCIALKRIACDAIELKSMRTVSAYRNKGVASALLSHVLDFAKQQKFKKISLETGTQDYFAPARQLYAKFGFETCGPFSDYTLDPNSHFMSRIV